MIRRRTTAFWLTTAACAAPLGLRAQGATPVEGKDFSRLGTPQPSGAGAGKVEVLEFFSFACPACNGFEPALEAWVAKLPAEVQFRRVPVPFLANWGTFQKAYYALESLNLAEKLMRPIFAAVHVGRQRLEKPEEIAAIVARNGGDAAKFLVAFSSFTVATAAGKAKKMTADYGIDSIPTLAVQGRFITSPSQAGGAQQALAVASALIQRKG